MTEYTISWRTENNEESSELDSFSYFKTLEEAQEYVTTWDVSYVREDALYSIIEVNTDRGDVVDSWSVTGGKAFWNEEDTSEEIISYIESYRKDS